MLIMIHCNYSVCVDVFTMVIIQELEKETNNFSNLLFEVPL